MLLGRLSFTALSTSLLLLGCASAPPLQPAARAEAQAKAKAKAKAVDPHYVVIQAEVSLSRTAQPAEQRQAALDPNADVMAEILAIPPGR